MISVRRGAREGEHGRIRNEAITNIIAWGRPGIERLIEQVGSDDVGIARGSVGALNDIVRALPPERGGGEKFTTDWEGPGRRAALKQQWTEWLNRDYKDP